MSSRLKASLVGLASTVAIVALPVAGASAAGSQHSGRRYHAVGAGRYIARPDGRYIARPDGRYIARPAAKSARYHARAATRNWSGRYSGRPVGRYSARPGAKSARYQARSAARFRV
jgi:hypothetical protein